MAFTFHIRPVGLDKGFDLSCAGIFPDSVHHSRLIEAVIHAVQVGHLLEGEIQVFDCEGNVAEILPVRWEGEHKIPDDADDAEDRPGHAGLLQPAA